VFMIGFVLVAFRVVVRGVALVVFRVVALVVVVVLVVDVVEVVVVASRDEQHTKT